MSVQTPVYISNSVYSALYQLSAECFPDDWNGSAKGGKNTALKSHYYQRWKIRDPMMAQCMLSLKY